MSEKLIAPSMLAADFSNLKEDLKKIEKNKADWLHVDIMDGHFVPNITFGPDQLKLIRNKCNIPFDVHLMITDPLKYIPRFIEVGADLISVHVETEDDLNQCYKLLEENNIKKGIVIKPETPINDLKPWLDRVDYILVMGVNPGFGGQAYIPETTNRIKDIKKLIGDRDILIEVDGGVNNSTIEEISEAGCDVFVAGSAVFNGDIKDNLQELRERIH